MECLSFSTAESFQHVLCCGPYDKIDRFADILKQKASPVPGILVKDVCLGDHGLVELPDFFRNPESSYSHYSFWQLVDILREKPLWYHAMESFGLSDIPPEKEPFRFPPGLLNLPLLSTVILKGMNLKVFPKEILAVRNLKILDISRNQLTALPEGLGCRKKLIYLNAAENQLTSLPASLGKLKKLQILNLSGNTLEHLGFSLKNMRELKRLNLSGNALSELPEGLKSLNQLERLLISYNNLNAEEEARWEEAYAAQIPSYQLHFAF